MNLLKQVFQLNRHDYLHILKTSIIYILFVTLLYTFFSQIVYNDRISEYKQLTLITDESNANYINFSISHYVSDLQDDLLILKHSDEIVQYTNEINNDTTHGVEQLFLRFSANKTDLSQIRIIDNQGMETIRVNHIEDPLLVSSEALQDKSNRYYYQETAQLEDGDVYISKLDLNIENDHIEIPYQPVIRISTPLYRESEFLGILVVNLDANYLLDAVFASGQTDYSETLSLFNQSGHYIYNDDPSILYGHVIKSRSENHFSTTYPAIDINPDSMTNTMTNDDQYFTFIEINPFEDIDAISDNGSWLIVHASDLSDVIPSNQIILTLNIYDLMIIFTLWIFIFLGIAITFINRRDGFKLNVVRRIADETSDSVIISNNQRLIEYANKSFVNFTGYELEEVINHHTRILKSKIHGQSFYKKLWDSIHEKGYWSGVLWQKKKNELIFPKQMIIYEMQNEKSKYQTNYVSLSKDLASSGNFIESNESLSNIDAFNDYLKHDLLEYFFNNNDFEDNMIFGAVALTLTNHEEYKHYEDLKYHTLEEAFIDFIKETFNEHFGFIVLASHQTYFIGFKNFKNTKSAKEFIENSLSQRLIHLKNGKDSFLLSFHAGVSITSKFHQDYELMINQAFTTLQYINTYKQNNLAYYSKTMADTIAQEKEIAYYLRAAIDHQEFYLVYQPQVDSMHHEITGYEVLLRWQNDTLGLVSPYAFIRVAEERGLIIKIGYWVIEEAFKHLNQMNLNGKKLSINISPLQFLDQKLPSEVSFLAAKYDINLTDIEFEVTESVLVTDFALAQNRLKTFKNLGISIAIDDFGTGYSSLQYISKFDLNKLKLDRSFIRYYKPGDELTIAKHVINLAKDLGLNVICEGTETIEQINYLKSIGAHTFQGYYYAKPMQLNEIATFEQSFNHKKNTSSN